MTQPFDKFYIYNLEQINSMKKVVILLLLVVCFFSCSVENEPKQHYEIVKVENFIVPDTFSFRQMHEIKLYYKRPTSCHAFNGFYFDQYENVRNIGIQCIVSNTTACQNLNEEAYEVSFEFYANSLQTYLFRFYKGKDEEGNAIFESVEIPVKY